MSPVVTQIDPSRGEDLARFVDLETHWMATHSKFVPAIHSELHERLSGQSAYFEEMEYALFTASHQDIEVARCAALINRRYQRAKADPHVGFIGHFAALPGHSEAIQAMLGEAESWLQSRQIHRMLLGHDGALVLGLGIRSGGFEREPIFPFGWTPAHLPQEIQDAGYAPRYPMWTYDIDLRSEAFQQTAAKAQGCQVHVRPISKRSWGQELETLRLLFNHSFKDEWEFHPFTEAEFHQFLDPIKPILDPQMIWIAESQGQAAGFCMGFPDWNPMFRSFRGKIGFFQILKMLFRAQRYEKGGLLAVGVHPDFKGQGIARKLAVSLYRRFQQKGLTHAEYHLVNEDNAASRSFAESMGGVGSRVYTCYEKVTEFGKSQKLLEE